ncbi:MAG TPA: hypothetical protein PKA06_09450, partial [Gemmatales bacterium]|nr:hypothetical protein [Gemmatales bacterium]
TEAVSSFASVTSIMEINLESVMPWTKNGQQWHLGPKGFPPGQGCQWDQALLPQLLSLLKKIDSEAEFNFNLRDAIHVKPSLCKAFWVRMKTKQANALELICYCTKGQFNITRFDSLSSLSDWVTSKPKVDEAQFAFTKDSDLQTKELTAFLTEVREGLLRQFGTGAA